MRARIKLKASRMQREEVKIQIEAQKKKQLVEVKD